MKTLIAVIWIIFILCIFLWASNISQARATEIEVAISPGKASYQMEAVKP